MFIENCLNCIAALPPECFRDEVLYNKVLYKSALLCFTSDFSTPNSAGTKTLLVNVAINDILPRKAAQCDAIADLKSL